MSMGLSAGRRFKVAQSNAAVAQQQQPLLSDFIGLYKSVLTKEECEEIIQNRFGRIRDVRIGKDGNIYLLTDEFQ